MRMRKPIAVFGQMISTLALLCASGVALAQNLQIPPKDRELLPSTPPAMGCSWTPFESPALGFRMLVQHCPNLDKHYEFAADGDWIVWRLLPDDTNGKWRKIIRILKKPLDLPIRDAIRQTFVAPLDGEAKLSCQVRSIKDSLVLGSEQNILDIVPTGQYGIKIAEEIKHGRKDFGCGEYGALTDDSTYFDFHPDEDPTKYLFIKMDTDKSLFDQDSILLYPAVATAEAKPPVAATTPWQSVSQDGFSKIFLDPASKKTLPDGLVSLRALTDYNPDAPEAKDFKLSEKGLSEVETAVFDCKAKTFRSDGGDWFREHMGKGAPARHYDAKTKWAPVPSFYAALFQRACAAK